MGEYEAELAYKSGLIDLEILRLHNVYGSPAELDPSKSQVIPALCKKTIEQKITKFQCGVQEGKKSICTC